MKASYGVRFVLMYCMITALLSASNLPKDIQIPVSDQYDTVSVGSIENTVDHIEFIELAGDTNKPEVVIASYRSRNQNARVGIINDIEWRGWNELTKEEVDLWDYCNTIVFFPDSCSKPGWSVAAGDFDGDGRTDLVLGDPFAADSGEYTYLAGPNANGEYSISTLDYGETGAVFIILQIGEYLERKEFKFITDNSNSDHISIYGRKLNSKFGYTIKAGYLNGDLEYGDLVIGAPGELTIGANIFYNTIYDSAGYFDFARSFKDEPWNENSTVLTAEDTLPQFNHYLFINAAYRYRPIPGISYFPWYNPSDPDNRLDMIGLSNTGGIYAIYGGESFGNYSPTYSNHLTNDRRFLYVKGGHQIYTIMDEVTCVTEEEYLHLGKFFELGDINGDGPSDIYFPTIANIYSWQFNNVSCLNCNNIKKNEWTYESANFLTEDHRRKLKSYVLYNTNPDTTDECSSCQDTIRVYGLRYANRFQHNYLNALRNYEDTNLFVGNVDTVVSGTDTGYVKQPEYLKDATGRIIDQGFIDQRSLSFDERYIPLWAGDLSFLIGGFFSEDLLIGGDSIAAEVDWLDTVTYKFDQSYRDIKQRLVGSVGPDSLTLDSLSQNSEEAESAFKNKLVDVKDSTDYYGYHYSHYDVYLGFELEDTAGKIFNTLLHGDEFFIKGHYTSIYNGGTHGFNVNDFNGDELDDILLLNSHTPEIKKYQLLLGKDSYSEIDSLGLTEKDRNIFNIYGYETRDYRVDRHSVYSFLGSGGRHNFSVFDSKDYSVMLWRGSKIPRVGVDEDKLDFGEYYLKTRFDTVGSKEYYELDLYNLGTDTLIISDLDFSGGLTSGGLTRDRSNITGYPNPLGQVHWDLNLLSMDRDVDRNNPLFIEPQSFKTVIISIQKTGLTHGTYRTRINIQSNDPHKREYIVPAKFTIKAADIILGSTAIDSFAIDVPNQIITTVTRYSNLDSSFHHTYRIDYEDYTDTAFVFNVQNMGNIPLEINHINLQLSVDSIAYQYSKIESDHLMQYFQINMHMNGTDYPLVLTEKAPTDSIGHSKKYMFRTEGYVRGIPRNGGTAALQVYFKPIDFVRISGVFEIYTNDPGEDPDFQSGADIAEDPKVFTVPTFVGVAGALDIDHSNHAGFILGGSTTYPGSVPSDEVTVTFDMGRVRMINADSANVSLDYPVVRKARNFTLDNFGTGILETETDILDQHDYFSYVNAPSGKRWNNSGWFDHQTFAPNTSANLSFKFTPGDFGTFETIYRISGSITDQCDPHVSLPEGNIFQERSYTVQISGRGYRPDLDNRDNEHDYGTIDLNIPTTYASSGFLINAGNLNLSVDLNNYQSRIFPVRSKYISGSGNTGVEEDVLSNTIYPLDTLIWTSAITTDHLYWMDWPVEKYVEIVVPIENNDPWTANDPEYLRFMSYVEPEEAPIATDTLAFASVYPYIGKLNPYVAVPISLYDTVGLVNRYTMLFGTQHIADTVVREVEYVYENKTNDTLYLNNVEFLSGASEFTAHYKTTLDGSHSSVNFQSFDLGPGERLYFAFKNTPTSAIDETVKDSILWEVTSGQEYTELVPAGAHVRRWKREFNNAPIRENVLDFAEWRDSLTYFIVDTVVIHLNVHYTSIHNNRIEVVDHIGSGYGQVSTTQFADAVGRVVETHVFDGHSDIVSGTEYKDYGLVVNEYRPFKLSTNSVDFLHENLGTSSSNFYSTWQTADPQNAYPVDPDSAYSQTTYEAAPLQRVISHRTPAGTGSSTLLTRFDYSVGNSDRLAFMVQKTLPNGVKIKQYSNLASQKTKQQTISADGSASVFTEFHYDDMGHLSKTVPPLSLGDSVSSYVSHYYYNPLGQLVKKEIPDADSTYHYRYDVLGNMRYYNDPKSQKSGQFYYYNYDVHGRVEEFGVASGNELPDNTFNDYTNGTPLILYEYDQAYFDARNVHGRLTHIQYNLVFNSSGEDIIGSDESWFSYDQDGRIEWTIASLYAVNGSSTIDREYFQTRRTYLLNGGVDETWYSILREGMGEQPLYYTRNIYDSFGRVSHTLGGRNEYAARKVNQNAYYFDGKRKWQGLMVKRQAHIDNMDMVHWNDKAAWQEREYRYDYLGRLAGINPTEVGVDSNARKLFAAEYEYDVVGNITRLKEKTWDLSENAPTGQAIYLDMHYTYDYLNRLASADINRGTAYNNLSDYGDIAYEYDKHGNILGINRTFATNASLNDTVTLVYESGRNRLSTVNNFTQDYDYSGNLIYDGLPSLTDGHIVSSVFYNEQNLPYRVEISNDTSVAGTIEYAYTPAGQRNRKVWKQLNGTILGDELYFMDIEGKKAGKFTIDSTGWLQVDYLNIYSGGELVGRYSPEAAYADEPDSVVMYITDHLGSVRIALSDTLPNNFHLLDTEPSDIAYTATYLPYGSYLPTATDLSEIQDEEFTGKALDDEFDLGWHYFGARFYRSRLGTWNAVDPLADQYVSISPYAYVANNPIILVDPDGQAVETALDAAAVGMSIYDLYQNPSWSNFGWMMADVVGAALPFIPAVGVIRHGRKLDNAAKMRTSVLGKFPDYLNVANKLGANRFSIPPNIWAKMTPSQQWGANVKFLDRMIARGDNVILSNPVKNINNVTGAFRKELDYLIGKGYKLNSNGTQLIR